MSKMNMEGYKWEYDVNQEYLKGWHAGFSHGISGGVESDIDLIKMPNRDFEEGWIDGYEHGANDYWMGR